eukprot:TRINITY_DN14634_c0_g1_i1.p1 TRINITY_DN14634_c0_g1~~TRINITY_DN14634_c0_g1_i1.p1  ORF type:complete len:505 (-),score=83.91 TRINITY_DN14634_c0_g1_i1:198-1712(-)
MDALLGCVFAAQTPSQPARVIFMHEIPVEDGQPSKNGRADEAEATRDCFGIPEQLFAKLVVPSDEMCNRAFYTEIDAGQQVTTHAHGPHSHLHLISFPCKVSEFIPSQHFILTNTESSTMAQTPKSDRVQRFSVVLVLESLRTKRTDPTTDWLWQVPSHLSRALVSEEMRVGYLSQEIKRLSAERELDPTVRDADASTVRFGLDHLLKVLCEGIKKQGYAALRINGGLMCEVCVFPKVEVPPPSPEQAFALMCSREDLLQSLPSDSSDIVRKVVKHIKPTVSLGELMMRLALPLGTLQRVTQHLVYWKKVREVDVFMDNTRVIAASSASARFHDWQEYRKKKQLKLPEITFLEVISAFSQGETLVKVRDRLRLFLGLDFDSIFEWLVAEGLLAQLGTFYHFLPRRADEKRKMPCSGMDIATKFRNEYCPTYLSDEEMRLLRGRAADDNEFRFLCQFVKVFVRKHLRTDGPAFWREAESLSHGSKQAENLLAKNDDIFAPYACRC